MKLPIETIVKNKKVAGSPITLLFYITEKLAKNSTQFYMSERVAKDLGISRGTYYRWRDILMEEGFIRKIDTHLYELLPRGR